MGRSKMNGVSFFSLLLGLIFATTAAAETIADSRPSSTIAVLGGMLDDNVPIERRRELGAALEAAALRNQDPYTLYLVGSLYRIGEDNSASPFRKDPTKSTDYLRRAALRGSLSAMEKLAFVERQARHRLDAAVWGQLFAWYAAIVEEAERASGLQKPKPNIAPLIAFVMDGFSNRDVAKLEARVREMIETHDTAIRAGINARHEQDTRNVLRNARADSCNLTELQTTAGMKKGRWPAYGGAEYFVQFAADGSVRTTWLIDAWPDVSIDRALRACAGRYRVTPFEAEAGKNDIALLPITIGNPRVKLRENSK